jgi:SNF2 family DNA or RNA helicase
MKLKNGTWVWSETQKQPALIIQNESLWGTQNILAWLPSNGHTVNLSSEEVQELDKKPISSINELNYIVIASRLVDLLSSDKPTTPLQADIIPLPHQIYAYKRATDTSNVRFLLADEVGLGKTIEAGLILKELKKQKLVDRTLIVSPRGLIKQWIDEMTLRFNENFYLINPSKTLSYEDENLWNRKDQIICSMDAVKPIEKRAGWSDEKLDEYNQRRFQDLIDAKWDLVIVDEAHKLSGSTTGVARHELGVALSESTPYLLLLSATPHQGKTEQFMRLMALLDPDTFKKIENINTETVRPYVIRTEKRIAIDQDGDPLFMPRITKLVPVDWRPKHDLQEKLYFDVTEYVRYGYNKAIEEKRNYIGFLMVLMQRLVSSSTRAIRETLERRLKILETSPAFFTQEALLEDFWTEATGQQKLDEILTKIGEGIRDEKDEVDKLASLARKAEITGPDAKAETLVEMIYEQRKIEQKPNLKFLIFTEFIPTQQMLQEFLVIRGFNVVILNGSMSLTERVEAQNSFANEADILISTEAGGEGINLQFCHIVFNYDLPWNPMRIEQRIGRIDRIGQKHPVKVYNLVFHNTVEQRVRQVLEEKLQVIMKEFGVDKLNDVLDADEAETDFETIYREAILNPEQIEKTINQYLKNIREKYRRTNEEKNLLQDEKHLDIEEIKELTNYPLSNWIERMTKSYLKAKGGAINETLTGYTLAWPDGTIMKNVAFQDQTEQYSKNINLNHPKIIQILENLTPHIQGMPIPMAQIQDLPQTLQGVFSLWRITVSNQDKEIRKILPIFMYNDGRSRAATATQLWNRLTDEKVNLNIAGSIKGLKSVEIYDQQKKLAEKQGEDKLIQAKKEFNEYLEKKQAKQQKYYDLQKRALSKTQKNKENEKQVNKIQESQYKWKIEFMEKKKPHVSLQALLIIHVSGSND